MKRLLFVYALCVLALTLGAPSSFAQSNNLISFQGQLTDTGGDPVSDGTYWMKFNIYCSSTGGDPLWSSDGHQPIDVAGSLFEHNLGTSNPLPDSLYKCDSLYLGITVGTDSEISPRTLLTGNTYTFRAVHANHSTLSDTADYARRADAVANSRDLYHEIVDINPYSKTDIHFVAWTDNPTVKFYLYLSEFQGALAEHTHDGNNAHSHDVTGTISTESVNHTHGISFNSGSSNATHNHTGSIGMTNLSHNHTASMSSSGAHHHDFLFQGALSGLFLVHNSDFNGLTAHGTYDVVATGSVSTNPSAHTHTVSIGNKLSDHNHSVTIYDGNATHTHSISGTTGSNSISHNHAFTGSISETGIGLEVTGINSTTTPSQVYVYVDDVIAAGPFDGNYATGELDLSGFVSGTGEHLIEIKEEGGSGGRISYNLFVE